MIHWGSKLRGRILILVGCMVLLMLASSALAKPRNKKIVTPSRADEAQITPDEAEAFSEETSEVQSTDGTAQEAFGDKDERYLLLTGDFYIPHVKVISDQDGVLRFAYGKEDHIYRVKKKRVVAVVADLPTGFTKAHPSMLEGGDMPPQETHAVREIREPQEETEEMQPSKKRPTFFIYGNVGEAQYAMKDLNRTIKSLNNVFRAYHYSEMPEIKNGLQADFGGGVWLLDWMALGLDIAYLPISTSGGGSSSKVDMNFSAMEAGGFIKVGTPVENSFRVTGTLAICALSLSDAYINDYEFYYGNTFKETVSLSGSTISIKPSIGLEIRPFKHFGIGVDVGYRWGVITEVRGKSSYRGDVKLYNVDQKSLEIDYSGAFAQGGVRVYF